MKDVNITNTIPAPPGMKVCTIIQDEKDEYSLVVTPVVALIITSTFKEEYELYYTSLIYLDVLGEHHYVTGGETFILHEGQFYNDNYCIPISSEQEVLEILTKAAKERKNAITTK